MKSGELPLREGRWIVERARKRKPQEAASLLFAHEELPKDSYSAQLQVLQDHGRRRDSRVVHVRQSLRTSDSSAMLLMPRRDRQLLFDFDQNVVLQRQEDAFSSDYGSLRKSFACFVSSAAFEIQADRTKMVEELVQGESLMALSAEERVPVVRECLAQLSDLVKAEDRGSSRRMLEEALCDGERRLPRVNSLRGSLLSWLGEAHLVPSHGDLSPNNIRVTNNGPVCYDFETVHLRPAWFDGVDLLLRARFFTRGELGLELSASLEPDLVTFLRLAIPGEMPSQWRRLILIGHELLARRTVVNQHADFEEYLAAYAWPSLSAGKGGKHVW